MKTINIQLQSLPIATPRPATFYLAGNFNHWQPNDDTYRFQANSDGSYQLAFQTELDRLEYKITRGHWSSAEGDEDGKERPNRIYQIGSAENNLWLQVECWTDAHARSSKGNVLLLHPDLLIPQLGRRRL